MPTERETLASKWKPETLVYLWQECKMRGRVRGHLWCQHDTWAQVQKSLLLHCPSSSWLALLRKQEDGPSACTCTHVGAQEGTPGFWLLASARLGPNLHSHLESKPVDGKLVSPLPLLLSVTLLFFFLKDIRWSVHYGKYFGSFTGPALTSISASLTGVRRTPVLAGTYPGRQ